MVIVIMGAAGAGKSTIGRALATELGWGYADGDDYHPAANVEKMRAGVPLTEGDRAPWIARLHAVIARAIERREPLVVACSALKARYRNTLRDDLHPVRFVYLKGSPALLQRRVAARPHHFFKPELVSTQLADLEEPADALTLDASWPPERIVAAIRHEFGV